VFDYGTTDAILQDISVFWDRNINQTLFIFKHVPIFKRLITSLIGNFSFSQTNIFYRSLRKIQF
jgi:hypothetical protein